MSKDVLELVMARHNNGHGFAHFQSVMEEFKDVLDRVPCIHVVGTNGKGTTSKYMHDMLVENGLKVGLFTSPHMETHLDRIRVDGCCIPLDVFEGYYARYEALIVAEDLSMFEIDVLFACLYFAECKCDLAIYEAGIGGRFDPTNVLRNKVLNVLTTVDFDHMNRLGNTIEEITFDKIGIVNNGVPLFVGNVREESKKVIDALGLDVVYVSGTYDSYLEEDYALACACVRYLGYEVVERNRLTPLLGRMQVFMDEPFILLDGAHNMQAIKKLVQSFERLKGPIVVVFACMKDKEVDAMMDELKASCDYFYGYSLDMDRAVRFDGGLTSLDEVVGVARKHGGSCVCCGSLYFVSELLKQK